MSQVRLAILLCGVLAMSSLSLAATSEVKLVASDYSDRYHVSTCKVAQKIPQDGLLTFATPEEAIAAGLRPCKKCNPPTTSFPVSD